MFFNSEDFNVRPRIPFQPSEEALKRWRSACAMAKNRRGRFRMVARLVNHAEARDGKLEIQGKKIISLSVRKAASQFIDDVPSSECAPPHGPYYFQKAALDFTRSLDDAPLSEYHAKARRFQEFVDDIGSTIKGHDLKIPKRTNAVFSLRVGNLLTYPVLKATSFGIYLLSHLVFKTFSSVRNIFSNLLLGVAFVRHKFQYYMSLCKYIVTLGAKVRRMQECLNDAEYISRYDDFDGDDDDDSKDHPISIIMEPVYNVSPNGKFRRRITSWQKGELWGSGSFGSVYEGLTDDGFVFTVKEVSLQDEGPRGKQSILQLDQEISL